MKLGKCDEDAIMGVMLKVLSPVLIFVLFGLVGCVCYVYFTITLAFYYPDMGIMKILHTIVAIWIIFNICFNYFRIMFVDPGSPTTESLKSIDLELNGNHQVTRYCQTCNAPKPPGCHHCHVCKKCVLQMDHHCPWVMNCVGYYNHKYFVLFLVYMTIGCTYVSLMTIYPLIISFYTKKFDQWIIISFIFTFVFGFALGAFAHMQLSDVLKENPNSSELNTKQIPDDYMTKFKRFFGTGRYWWTFLLPSLTLIEGDGINPIKVV